MTQHYLKSGNGINLHALAKYAAILASPLLLTGCVDNNYDLDNIDTTTRIPISNLVVPLNLNTIYLDDVLDLSDNENITVISHDNKELYAIKKSGTFTSDDVSISPVHVSVPPMSSNSISLVADVPIPSNKKAFPAIKIDYPVTSEMLSDFSFNSQGIDDALVAIKSISTSAPVKLSVKLTLPESLAANVGKVIFENINFQFPKGFHMADGSPAHFNIGNYNPTTGKATINTEVELKGSNFIELTLSAEVINAEEAGIGIENHAIDYAGAAGLLVGGNISLVPSFDNITLPTSFNLSGDYSLTSFDLKTVSGTIDYHINGINVEPIDLSSLPDFLADSQTDIRLNNPQIYLGVINTTADYHTGMEGSLSLTSIFDNNIINDCQSPTFGIGWDKGPVRYNIALAANPNDLMLESEYKDAEKYTYVGLGNILSNPEGAGGLPKTVNVSLNQLRFFGNAQNFPIRQNDGSNFGVIEKATGEYSFLAPLNFEAGSQIIYHKTEEDISSDGLDKITVNYVKLNAQAITNIPLNVKLELAVYNKAGNKVGRCEQPIVIAPNSNSPVTLIVESTPDSPITDINAVEYRAVIMSSGENRAISPDQYIKLDNLRLTVDGFIDTDF